MAVRGGQRQRMQATFVQRRGSAPATPAPVPAPQPPAAPPAPPAVIPYPVYAVSSPPPGYEYYYALPPLPPPPRFAPDAAVSSTPFVDMTLVGVNWQNRVSEFLNIGAQAGVFVAGRLRLTARIAFPTEQTRDEYYSSGDFFDGRVRSKSYSLLYGATAGIAAVSSASFVMSPGLAFGRSDVSDYGSTVAFAMPFDWVLSSGLRIGVEVDFGRAFGGRYVAACATGVPCTTVDRPSGTAFLLQFHMGFGFNHPAPLPLAQPPSR